MVPAQGDIEVIEVPPPVDALETAENTGDHSIQGAPRVLPMRARA
jgi:hypothetical protein